MIGDKWWLRWGVGLLMAVLLDGIMWLSSNDCDDALTVYVQAR